MATDTPSNYYADAKNWHEDMIATKDKQISTYRTLALGTFAGLILAIICITALVTRETVQPFLVLTDKRTGEVTTPARLNTKTLSEDWNMVRHFVSNYVQDREGYNFLNLNAPYKNLLSMSTPAVVAQIDQYIRPELNAESPITVLGQNRYVTVVIHTINKMSSSNKLLDVRFTTNTINTADNKTEKSQEWRATMRWELVNKKRSPQEWDTNPLGFTVSLYDKQPIV